MSILTINSGSSSVRLDLYQSEGDCSKIRSAHYKTVMADPELLLDKFIDESSVGHVSVTAHRVVHGGNSFSRPSIIDDKVIAEIKRLSVLAPLHNPKALQWIAAAKKRFLPEVPHVAVFDTSFYADLPNKASTYALPGELCRFHEIKRYGFHGLAHEYMLRRWMELRPEVESGGAVITIQLGAGCSITAIQHGRAIDTSMGFSPLEGLVMSTRCGDIDPDIVPFLMRHGEMTLNEIESLLNHRSGLLGLSGESGDMRLLLDSDSAESRLAVDMYCYRIKKYIGAYIAALGGVDAIIFGGGVGENAPYIRSNILEDMQWCGISLDPVRNEKVMGEEGSIRSEHGRVALLVMHVDESALLMTAARVFLQKVKI